MKTKLLTKNDIDIASKLVKEGELVAIMTDTVYGLAASSAKEENYSKLQVAKQRPADKPFPLMVGSKSHIENVAILGDLEHALIDKFMPGPVTFIFNRKPDVFKFLDDQKTLGIRMADDLWVQDFIHQIGSPIWLPSANVSGQDTATSSDMVLNQLSGSISAVIEGNIEGGKSSSIFDLTGDEVVCLREGIVPIEAVIEEASKWKK